MVHGTGADPGSPGREREMRRETGDGSQSTGQAGDQVRHQASRVAGQVQEQAGELAGMAREQGMSWASGQKDRVAQSMSSVSRALRQTRQSLEEDGQPGLARAVDVAAERVDQVSRFVRERDTQQLLGEVERTARRRPELFVGGAFVLGLLAARFLKSSAPETDTGGAYAPGAYGYQQGSASSGAYSGSRYGGGASGGSAYGVGYGGTASSPESVRSATPATQD